MVVALPIATVMFSCCSCVVYLEFIQKQTPGAMNLLTAAEFLFISLEGIVFVSKFFTVKPVVPYRNYFLMVLVFFIVNVINNWALSFQVPLPLHIIFRSGSLLANMVLGMILMGKRYDLQKYLSVALITVGIIVCTLASSNQAEVKPHGHPQESAEEAAARYGQWLIGISMLTIALLLSAYLGLLQEKLHKDYGKNPREALFYSHFLPLPAFAFFAKDIYQHVLIFNESPPTQVPLLGIEMPTLWYYLLMSILTQYVCIRSVYTLTSECSSLTVTLVVTLRKFVSLLISILYFRNPFTVAHWLGALAVFGGTLLFADVFRQAMKILTPAKEKVDGKKTN